MIIEFEVSPPFQRKPDWFHSRIQRRFTWGWFAVALTKGSAEERSKQTAAGLRGWVYK